MNEDEMKIAHELIDILDQCLLGNEITLSRNRMKQLLDLITNLQEELKSANESITWWNNRFNSVERDNRKLQGEKEQLNSLLNSCQEEIRRLKELCDKYEEEHNTTFEYWKRLVKEDYKSRIDKAIEYTERCRDYHRDIHKEEKIFPDEITSLLMILQGEDKQ